MRTKWTDELFDSEVKKISDGLSRMPTNTELREMGRNDLASQIVQRGGYLAIAKRMGLNREFSDSDFGWSGEVKVEEALSSMGFSVERSTKVRWPFDLMVNGLVRVDVKTAKYAEYGPCKGWFFRIGKVPQCDVVVLYQMDTGNAYILHWSDCPTSNITISRGGGKYKESLNDWPIIGNFLDSTKQFKSKIKSPVKL